MEGLLDQQKHHILIVDDNPDWQLTFRGVLKSAGFEVTTAASREEAIQKLAAERFDLALLDIRLDESNENDSSGLALAEQISQRWDWMKVIIATGYTSDEFIRKALTPKGRKRLAVGFVQKQDVGNLARIIAKALAQ